MPVEDVFSISGRGTVVTGRIERGVIKVNEEVEIVGLRPTVKTVCTGVEMFRKLLDEGQAGTTWGAAAGHQARGSRARAGAGQARQHQPRTRTLSARVRAGEGGRRAAYAVFQGLPAAVLFSHHGRDRHDRAARGVEMVMPGDNIKMTIELISPIAMEDGLRFAIREGGKTVGAGVVTKILK